LNERILFTAAAPFEAARQVDILPDGHRSKRLHGHSFTARVRAELPSGWAPFFGAETDTLEQELIRCVSMLDYDLLNKHIDVPTDENLARWVQECLQVPNIEMIGVQSTRNEGADLDTQGNAHIGLCGTQHQENCQGNSQGSRLPGIWGMGRKSRNIREKQGGLRGRTSAKGKWPCNGLMGQ
jgi:6-pyruvoyl-tetrahydropterin synthase